MTDYQIDLVQQSWIEVFENQNNLGEKIYQALFKKHPSLIDLFDKANIEEQGDKLVKTLNFIVNNLNQLDNISNEVKSLAKKHKKYGVKAEYFPLVNNLLLDKLCESLGPKWTQDHYEAWYLALNLVSNLMIRHGELNK